MDRKLLRSNQYCHRDQSETMIINGSLARLNVSSCEESVEEVCARESFDDNVRSNRSVNEEYYNRESIDVHDIQQQLSVSVSVDYPLEVDSRDPQDDKHCDSRERRESTSTNTESAFSSPIIRAQGWSCESSPNDNSFFSSISSLKRANPIYESDSEYDEKEHHHYSAVFRKRRCSEDRVTAIYWHHELKTADE